MSTVHAQLVLVDTGQKAERKAPASKTLITQRRRGQFISLINSSDNLLSSRNLLIFTRAQQQAPARNLRSSLLQIFPFFSDSIHSQANCIEPQDTLPISIIDKLRVGINLHWIKIIWFITIRSRSITFGTPDKHKYSGWIIFPYHTCGVLLVFCSRVFRILFNRLVFGTNICRAGKVLSSVPLHWNEFINYLYILRMEANVFFY